MNFGRYLKILLKSFVDFFKDGGVMLAGSLSYFFIMAIIPFCLFLVALFGYFIGENQAFLKFFSAKLTGLFPSITYKITEELKKLISYRGLGTFTFILYGLLSFQLLSSLETAVNTVFKIRARRPFPVSLVRSLFIVTLIFIVISVSFGATSAISILKAVKEVFPDIRVGKISGFLIVYLVPFMLTLLIVAIMYKFLPLSKVQFRNALAGSTFTTIFHEAAKHLFTFYVVKVVHLGAIYGPLSVFVIFLLWVFYSSCIFLIGAEVVHNLQAPAKRFRTRSASV
jgi:membrane protein